MRGRHRQSTSMASNTSQWLPHTIPDTIAATGYRRLHQQRRREANLYTKSERAAERRNVARSNHYASGTWNLLLF